MVVFRLAEHRQIALINAAISSSLFPIVKFLHFSDQFLSKPGALIRACSSTSLSSENQTSAYPDPKQKISHDTFTGLCGCTYFCQFSHVFNSRQAGNDFTHTHISPFWTFQLAWSLHYCTQAVRQEEELPSRISRRYVSWPCCRPKFTCGICKMCCCTAAT